MGIVVVHPQGYGGGGAWDSAATPNSWNAGTCCGPAKLLAWNDVGYFEEIMDILVRDHSVDPD